MKLTKNEQTWIWQRTINIQSYLAQLLPTIGGNSQADLIGNILNETALIQNKISDAEIKEIKKELYF